MNKVVFIAVSLLLLSLTNAHSQAYYDSEYGYYHQFNDYDNTYDEDIPMYDWQNSPMLGNNRIWGYSQSLKIKSYHCEVATYRDNKPKKILISDYFYSQSGNTLRFSKIKTKPQKNKVKPKDLIVNVYTPDNLLKEYACYMRGGEKLSFKTVNTYDSSRLLAQAVFYRGKKIRYTGRTTYQWYSKSKPKEIIYYKRRELNPKIVSFDCLPEGKINGSRGDTITVCKKMEFDTDGNSIEISSTIDKKGRELKRVTKRNMNKRIVSIEDFDKKGRYSSGTECLYNEEGKLIKEVFYKRDKKEKRRYEYSQVGDVRTVKQYVRGKKLKTTTITTFTKKKEEFVYYKKDENGNVVERKELLDREQIFEQIKIKKTGTRKHQYSRTVNQYDDNGLMVKSMTYDKEGLVINGASSEYDSNKLLIKDIDYSKNGRQIKMTTYHYNEKKLCDKIEVFNKKNELKSSKTWTFEYFQ